MSALRELMEYTFVSKYARYDKHKKRREVWQESVNRVRNMMLYKYKDYDVADEINWAYDMMLKKKVIGSNRATQYGGKPMLTKNMRGFNCTASYCDRLHVFQEYFWILLCGAGCGVSIQKHHVIKLPELNREKRTVKKTYVIPDTIEGWADSLGVLLSSYFESPVFKDYYGKHIVFDYSEIRPKGSLLSSGVGLAPGPDGLRNALEKIRKLLDNLVRNKQFRLKPINAYDIFMHTSDAVLSGGVRRSATLIMFSPDDEEMLRAKIGNWREENPQRARSNNSAVLLRDKTSFEDFNKIMSYTKEYGEPAVIWSDDLEQLFNPCVESNMYGYDDKGNSGWQACNLCSINCSNLKNKEDLYERAKAASIIGTLQAGFDKFDYLGPVSEYIVKREALLGVSLAGIMNNPDICLNKSIQKNAARIVKKTNEQFAPRIGVNISGRTTLEKPDGHTGALLGSGSGIHPHHSKRYLRGVQVNKQEKPYQHFRKYNPQACEESVWCSDNTDDIIFFPIEVEPGAKLKNMMPALELLKAVKLTQSNWVAEGRNEKYCVKPFLNHNVSNTISVDINTEWEDVIKEIYKNRKYYCGVSLISSMGDKDYPQAPFVNVLTSHELVKEYGEGAVWCSGLIELAFQAYGDLWKACDAVLTDKFEPLKGLDSDCANDLHTAAKRKTFNDKFCKFVNSYFDSDKKRLSYCMKDVHNSKLYTDLSKSFKSVDYTKMNEEEDNTTFHHEVACAGGACEI